MARRSDGGCRFEGGYDVAHRLIDLGLRRPDEASSVTISPLARIRRRIVALALRLARETFGEDEVAPSQLNIPTDKKTTDALVAVAKARFAGAVGAVPTIVPARIEALHPYAAPLAFWIRSRERVRDQVVCAARFVFEPAPGESGAGVLDTVMRPARLAANALIRAVHAS